MNRQKLDLIIQIITISLILLFVYTATSKLVALNSFKVQLKLQNFSNWYIPILSLAIPLSELIAAGLLAVKYTRLVGLILSSALMAVFTLYIGLALVGFYEKVPCSCGGVLSGMGWQPHFWFNLFFLLLAVIGWRLHIYTQDK